MPARLTRAQPGRKLTEQEQWEAKQLKQSGVVQVDELPEYDHESGTETFETGAVQLGAAGTMLPHICRFQLF